MPDREAAGARHGRVHRFDTILQPFLHRAGAATSLLQNRRHPVTRLGYVGAMKSFAPWAIPIAAVAAIGFSACDDPTSANPLIPPCHLEDPPAPAPPGRAPSGTFDKINHFVVIYLENRSFDNLYGEFKGAEGFSMAANVLPQVDVDGGVYANLPPPMSTDKSPAEVDPRFPKLPNAPFSIEKYVPATEATSDLVHRWFQEQQQIHGGKMDLFAAVSDAKGLSMGYYHTAGLPLAKVAADYTVCDHFFHAAFGGSFLNHQWLIAAASPVFPSAPTPVTAQVDGSGKMVADGVVLPSGCYAVNTAFSVNKPHPSTVAPEQLIPSQTNPTIGDRLSEKYIDWAWYSGGWNDALAGKPDPKFQFHHQPFVYFKSFADGTEAKATHLKDETDFLKAATTGTLPAVSFVKPIGALNEHPGYAALVDGENHVVELIDAVRRGPNWKDTAIIVTYDENGGFWDHMAPPARDKWGPGTRVPTIIISPYAKKKFVDPTVYDTTAILATIEHRWGLDPLAQRDAASADLANGFDFKPTP